MELSHGPADAVGGESIRQSGRGIERPGFYRAGDPHIAFAVIDHSNGTSQPNVIRSTVNRHYAVDVALHASRAELARPVVRRKGDRGGRNSACSGGSFGTESLSLTAWGIHSRLMWCTSQPMWESFPREPLLNLRVHLGL